MISPGVLVVISGGGVWPSWVRPENGTAEVLATGGGLTLGTGTEGLSTGRRRLGLQAAAGSGLGVSGTEVLSGSWQV